MRNKPSLASVPKLVFYDDGEIKESDVSQVVGRNNVRFFRWPPWPIAYFGQSGDRWEDPQREKMLSGFVYMAAHVETPYWLKVDTDVVAKEMDSWISDDWFVDDPAIVAHCWSFTKPPNQMLVLDEWAEECQRRLPEFQGTEPLRMVPQEGKDRLGHKRIISWCAFFNTEFTKKCIRMAEKTCGYGRLPVSSQDGYLWYCARRMGLSILRPNMRRRGWLQRLSIANIRKEAEEAMWS